MRVGASVRRRCKLELKEPHHENPAETGVPMVGERADLEVLAGCGGRPFGGGPVVVEHVGVAALCGAVAVRVGGDLRPRAEVRITPV